MSVKPGCGFLKTWKENQSPLGSGRYWPETFEECCKDCPEQERQMIDAYGECDEGCPGFEPETVAVCPKHGEYLERTGCEGCMYRGYGDEAMVDFAPPKTGGSLECSVCVACLNPGDE